ncbi:stalk domain-containing protein [Paenibacillus sp. Marseille-Q4541]|uniref:stalk domain-containing protein n=1 Tax=Paenibacillus sp. Marseille-Q4541 TaxID=2831522 RepID=UPI001BA9D966|nr:stalk domain-containing protein [Paenibacillus sp. Marseille-Q4541]
MKKLWNRIASVLLISIVVAGSVIPLSKAVAKKYNPVVFIDDQETRVSSNVKIEKGVFILPLKVIHELASVELAWDNVHKRASVNKNGNKYLVSAGSNQVLTNKDTIELKVPAQLKDGNMLIPASLLEEISGATFTLSEDKNTAEFKTTNYYKMSPKGEPDTVLVPVKVEESGYVKGMKLRLAGTWSTYPEWEGLWNWRYKPEIHVEDISGDGKNEMVVINTLGYGTGLFMQEVKVIDPSSRKEVRVDSLERIVDENIKSEMTLDKDQMHIQIQIKGNQKPITQTIENPGYNKDEFNKKIGFGSVQRYELKDGKLMTTVAATYDFGIPVGDLVITYQYKDQRYQADSIKYIPLQM